MERQVRDRARLLAEDVDREVGRMVAAGEVLATDDALSTDDFAAFHARAAEVRDLLGTNVLIRDRTSQQLVNTRVPWGTPLPRNPVFEVDRRAIETGRPQVSGLLMGAVARTPLLIVVVPVIRGGEVRHLLSLTISLGRLQRLLSPERLPPGWIAGILDTDGTIIARSGNAEALVGTRLPAERWSLVKGAPEGVHRTIDLDGEAAIQAYARSEVTGWLVGVSVREALIETPVRQTLLLFAGGGLVLVLISVGTAVALGRRLARPIVQLALAAEAVGASRPVAVPDPGVTEIDAVGAALRDAAGVIRARTGALNAARNEADRANLAKSKFLAAASHDLRQPAQSLVLFHALLAERLKEHPVRPILERMGEAMGGLRMLLDSLLDVSRLDAGLVVPRPEDLPLGALLLRLGAEYQPQASAKGLRLRVVPTAAVVRADPALLERMLRNFIENALRYTERGGVLLGCRRRGDLLRIAVVDTGVGITADQQTAIFEEFYQVGNPERDRNKGLGLGLAVVERLSRLLGHPVSVRSVPHRGSAFSVDVPLAGQSARAAPAAEPLPAATSARGRILVIDDEALVRMGLQAMLEGWGYEVLAAGSVGEAIGHVEQGQRPHAILADFRLRGGETGLDAIRAVHARLKADVPATIITGDTAPERLTEVREGGFVLLHKPVAARDLRRSVTEMMRAAE